MSSIPGSSVEERAQVLLGPIDRYRGEIPAGALLAIAEHESTMGLWEYNSKGSGATGPWQIMPEFFGDYRVDAESAFDPEASTRGVLRVRQRAHNLIARYAPQALSDIYLYTYLLYGSHYAGNTALERDLKAAEGNVTTMTVGGWGAREGLLEAAGRAAYWEDWAISIRGGAPFERGQWVVPWGPLLFGLALCATAGVAGYCYRRGVDHRFIVWEPSAR